MKNYQTIRFREVPYQRDADIICICGREAIVHCPSCGSISRFAKKANSIKCQVDMQNLTFAIAQGYICRRCGADYNEEDLKECHAPAVAEGKRFGQSRRGVSTRNSRASQSDSLAEHQRLNENQDLLKIVTAMCLEAGLGRLDSLKVICGVPQGLIREPEDAKRLIEQILQTKTLASLESEALEKEYSTPQEELAAEQGDGLCHCESLRDSEGNPIDNFDGGRVCLKCGFPASLEMKAQIESEEDASHL